MISVCFMVNKVVKTTISQDNICCGNERECAKTSGGDLFTCTAGGCVMLVNLSLKHKFIFTQVFAELLKD